MSKREMLLHTNQMDSLIAGNMYKNESENMLNACSAKCFFFSSFFEKALVCI